MRDEMKKIFDEVKANNARLDGCDNHDFEAVPKYPDRPMGLLTTDYRCKRCGGRVDSIARGHYELGRKHAAADRVLTCVYCGHAYPPGSPSHGSSVLTEHIKVCETHPLRQAERDLAAARSERDAATARAEAAEAELRLVTGERDAARAVAVCQDVRRLRAARTGVATGDGDKENG